MEQNEEESRLGERYQFFLVPGLALLLAGTALSKGLFVKSVGLTPKRGEA
jgi:hypothetical protein